MAGYRLARYDEEIRHEAILSNPGDKRIWKENGGKLINFKDWLIGNKRSHNDKVEEEEWHSTALAIPHVNGLSEVIKTENGTPGKEYRHRAQKPTLARSGLASRL